MSAPEILTVEDCQNASVNAEAVRKIREWCDRVDANTAIWLERAGEKAAEPAGLILALVERGAASAAGGDRVSPTLLREAKPIARKEHTCEDCFTCIPKGTTYHRATLIYDGHVYDWVECLPCTALSWTVWQWGAEWRDEGVGPEDFEEWAEAHRDDAEHGEDARAFLVRRAAACSTVTSDPAP